MTDINVAYFMQRSRPACRTGGDYSNISMAECYDGIVCSIEGNSGISADSQWTAKLPLSARILLKPWLYQRFFLRNLSEYNIDIVHGCDNENASIAYHAASAFNVPFVFTLRGYMSDALLYPPFVKKYGALADMIVVNSEFLKNHYNWLNDNIRVLYNPIDTYGIPPTFDVSCKEKRIVYAGGKKEKKGYDVFTEAAHRFAEEHSDWHYVTVKGMKQKQLFHLIRTSMITCVPSLWDEPFGRVMAESMMLGTMVVSSGRGGMGEIAGKNIIVEPSVEGLIDGFETAAAMNPDEYSDAVIYNHDFIKSRCCPSTFYTNLDELYREVLYD